MHYFKRNIGDYHKKAGRLTMLEHGAYTLLMDACYDREAFPTLQQAHDWCGTKSAEENAAVESVLAKFFTLKPNKTYFQARISEELSNYKKKGIKNKEIALARERTKRERSVNETYTERTRTDHETAPNHKPITTNQEPLKDRVRFAPPSASEVIAEFGNEHEGRKFHAFYESKDWMVGKSKMKKWKSAVVGWKERNGKSITPVITEQQFIQQHTARDWAEDLT